MDACLSNLAWSQRRSLAGALSKEWLKENDTKPVNTEKKDEIQGSSDSDTPVRMTVTPLNSSSSSDEE